MTLAIALIAAWAVLLPLGIWATVLLDRRKQQQETDWIAPHAGWIAPRDVEREFWAIVAAEAASGAVGGPDGNTGQEDHRG